MNSRQIQDTLSLGEGQRIELKASTSNVDVLGAVVSARGGHLDAAPSVNARFDLPDRYTTNVADPVLYLGLRRMYHDVVFAAASVRVHEGVEGALTCELS